jgi:hypothetical protein
MCMRLLFTSGTMTFLGSIAHEVMAAGVAIGSGSGGYCERARELRKRSGGRRLTISREEVEEDVT